MGEIRIVGRTAPRRCPYCHDLLGEESISPCRGCEVLLHDECWRELDTCPSAGCNQRRASAPRPWRRADDEAARRQRAQRRQRLEREREAGREELEREREEAAREKPRPAWWARIGPYARLTVSAACYLFAFLFTSLVLLFLGAQVAKIGHREPWLLGALAVAVAALYVLGKWLARVPGTYLALSRMLDDEHPVWAHLTVNRVISSAGRTQAFWANLRVGDRELRFKLSPVLRPLWLNENLRNEGVWLHGYRDSGEPPWVLEFEDGWLALVYPDESDLVAPEP